jgi:hypothetical protein
MDQTPILAGLIAAAAIGIFAAAAILRRGAIAGGPSVAGESLFAASTEGMKRCPSCGVGNLVTEGACSACGKPLSG